MSGLLTSLGVLILTFWVSRAFLAALRRTNLNMKQQLMLGHAASLVLIGLFVFWVKVFAIFAPFIYIPGQLVWLAFDWLSQRPAEKPPSRRRRSNSTTRPTLTLPAWLVPSGMGALTIAYVMLGWMIFGIESKTYNNIFIGNTPQEVIYAVGKPVMARNSDAQPWQPAQTVPNGSEWMFTTPFMIVTFNPDQTVRNVVCANKDKVSQGACVSTLKVDIGDHEATVFAKLGFPSSYTTTSDGKRVFSYPELGHDFVFEQFYVRSIRVYAANGDTLGWFWRFVLWITP